MTASSPEARALVDDWTRRVVLYDLGVERATATPRPDGRFDVTVRLRASRTEGGRTLPLDEEVDLGLYTADPASGAAPVAIRTVRVRGDREVRLVAEELPAFVAVDPLVRRVDLDPEGQSARVEGGDVP